ncbi:hypothetical protein AGMMS49975_26180 [Clostridia bacterium]|nr:hypothetical protein AGMMS49975_26180 [Clostridia bacterium]
MKRALVAAIALAANSMFTARTVSAADSLFYVEAQGVAGYSSEENGAIYRSGGKDDVMQKNSIGFDLIKKFSGGSRLKN